MNFELENKVALVTGGSKNIGKEIVLSLASEKVNIAFTYNSSENQAEETLSEIMKLISKSSEILRKTLNAEGFNIGANIGSVGGAGIDDHLHFHVVPRWKGDTNFMPVVGNTKVIMSGLHDTYDELFFHFQKGLAK